MLSRTSHRASSEMISATLALLCSCTTARASRPMTIRTITMMDLLAFIVSVVVLANLRKFLDGLAARIKNH